MGNVRPLPKMMDERMTLTLYQHYDANGNVANTTNSGHVRGPARIPASAGRQDKGER